MRRDPNLAETRLRGSSRSGPLQHRQLGTINVWSNCVQGQEDQSKLIVVVVVVFVDRQLSFWSHHRRWVAIAKEEKEGLRLIEGLTCEA